MILVLPPLDLSVDVRVFPVVLTLDQVQYYQLPRTPIKETERRRGGFEGRYGEDAVELDALEALYLVLSSLNMARKQVSLWRQSTLISP